MFCFETFVIMIPSSGQTLILKLRIYYFVLYLPIKVIMQIYKGGLFKTATEHKEQTRYFSQAVNSRRIIFVVQSCYNYCSNA